MVLVSGDVAYSAAPAEYDLARAFFDDLLEATGLDKDRLFVVPGNHDVDRGAISTLAAGATAILNSRDAVNQFLASDGDRALVLQRFHHYQDFFNSYFGKRRLPFDHQNYFFTRRIVVGGKRVAILGLNSAWLSASDADRHRLLLGERQVRAALDQAREADIRLAVMHHPLDWLQDFDRSDAEPLLHGGCDLILHGHMHQVGLLQARTPDAEAMVIAAGACYETRQYPNSYNLVRLDLAAGTGTVFLRMYSDRQGGFWTRDVVNYRNVQDGTYTFSLPERLRPHGRPGDTAGGPAEPRAGTPPGAQQPAGKRKRPGTTTEPARVKIAPHDSRIKALDENISRQYALLHEYETTRDLSSDPKEIARAGREIAAIRSSLQRYLEEYRQICRDEGQELPAELQALLAALLAHGPAAGA
jgi:hypothetical protein